MKTGNKKKSRKNSDQGENAAVHPIFRDAEADALHVQRCQLDRATLLACAVKRLREEQAGESASGQKPSA